MPYCQAEREGWTEKSKGDIRNPQKSSRMEKPLLGPCLQRVDGKGLRTKSTSLTLGSRSIPHWLSGIIDQSRDLAEWKFLRSSLWYLWKEASRARGWMARGVLLLWTSFHPFRKRSDLFNLLYPNHFLLMDACELTPSICFLHVIDLLSWKRLNEPIDLL